MEFCTILLVLTLLLGFYTAWNIGANDVANAMGTSVGSGALTLKKAVIIAAVLEFAGAFFLGRGVSDTLSRGIVDPIQFSDQPLLVVYGMMAVLLSAGIWMQIASYFGWPVSTTHTIVGALLGFGLMTKGVEGVNWKIMGVIFSSWVFSPLIGGIIAFCLFSFLRNKILYSRTPLKQAKLLTPWITFAMFFIFSLLIFIKGLKNLDIELSPIEAAFFAFLTGALAFFICKLVLGRIKETTQEPPPITLPPGMTYSINKVVKHLRKLVLITSGHRKQEIYEMLQKSEVIAKDAHVATESHLEKSETQAVEKIFAFLQVISACFMAFAHGANDIANAVGPLASAVHIIRTGSVHLSTVTPPWILILGGVGLVIGVTTWGWRVIATIGKKITELTPTRGFAAELAAAITILIATLMKLPVSTTHTLIGAVFGIGLAKGIYAINLSIIRNIFTSWIITVPAGMLLSTIFMYIIKQFL